MLERIRRQVPALMAAIALVAAVIVMLIPPERTLGTGIRIVLVHVAFTWTGLVCFLATGVLGLALAASGDVRVKIWMQTLGFVALGAFASGLVTSLIAAQINWGGVFWQEPRFLASQRFLAVATMGLVALPYLPKPRLRGLLTAALVAGLAWFLLSAPLHLHPESPLKDATSTGIQTSAFFLLIAFLAQSALLTWRLTPRVLARDEISETSRSRSSSEASH